MSNRSIYSYMLHYLPHSRHRIRYECSWHCSRSVVLETT